MSYRARFESLVSDLQSHPKVTIQTATIGPPTDPAVLVAAQKIAGKAWPSGMTAFFEQMSSVSIAFVAAGTNASGGPCEVRGTIAIPRVEDMFDYAGLEEETWFDFLESDHPFHLIRPLDRFVPEAYAVLYPVNINPAANAVQSRVMYHFCGEELWETGMSFEQYIDFLLITRGIHYSIKLKVGPRGASTWVEEMHDAAHRLFPDFDPNALAAPTRRAEIRF